MSRAKYIVIIGPDGSGKTSVADGLATALAMNGRTVARHNFSFGIMPPISLILGRRRRKAATEGQRDVGMVKPLNRNHAILLAIWYGVDHLLGHWRLWRQHQNDVVIFARSYHDFLYQRAYLNLPLAVPRLFLLVGPRPSLIATPVRAPEEIHDKKPELTRHEISEQYKRIRARLHHYESYYEIVATDGIKLTVNRLKEKAGL